MNSRIVELVKYTSIFGNIDWLSQEEAEGKLEIEQKLYDKWSSAGADFIAPHELHQPKIHDNYLKFARGN